MENSEKDIKNNENLNSGNKKESEKSLNENNKSSLENISQNQNKKRGSNSSNIQNSSLNLSINNENQSQSSFQNNQAIPQNQNINIFSNNPPLNFPPKEYFNFSFFKRQMSSRSSDVDIYQDNKEGINEFFNTKCKSIISRDSEKFNNSKKSSELNSFDYTLPNLGNKDENSQIFLTRANSARTQNYNKSNNYIPKAVYFQRNNSNNPSCFYKKHNIGKQNIKNSNEENNNNLVLKYYGNNNEFNYINKNILEMVNDKEDEAEEDEENSEEDEEDDCILTKKDKDNFSVNYLSINKGINLPKTTFSLFHRGNNNIKLEKEKEKKDKEEKNENLEINKKEENKGDIKIIFNDFMKKENNEDKDYIKDESNNEIINREIIFPLAKNEDEFDDNVINNKSKEIVGNYILNNNMNNNEINNKLENEGPLKLKTQNNLIDKEKQIIAENNENIVNIVNKTNLYTQKTIINNKNILNTNINNIPNFQFNNNNISNYTNETEEFLKNVLGYIKDQQGCRYIQKKIEENPEISNNLFDILKDEILSMSKDLFGNYVVQKILENVKSNYLTKFIDLISKDFYNLSTSIYGTRVVQKILEIVSRKSYIIDKDIYEQCFKKINNYITEDIVALSSNNNSSHIIIKYVNEIKYPQNEQLYSEVYNNFIPLCKNKHGCCVIQKCLELGNKEQKNKLLELSNINCDNLISDQFGNYVIQFVVNLNVKLINTKVFEILNNNLIPLCKEKYASNVIEKFLINKSPESIEIINILLKNEKYLHELIKDPFGNYIIQRILLLIEGENRSNLIHLIVKWYPEIKTLSFGPRLISKLHERFQEFTVLVTQKYGWEATQEISYLYSKNNLKNNIASNNNNCINGLYYMNNLKMVNNLGYGMNVQNPNFNNNYMNFQNKNNVGNINFIQMNNYMLTNGQNNLRFPMTTLGGFNNFNNFNNGQFFTNYGNINNINNNINQNVNTPINKDINNNILPRLNIFGFNNNANYNNNFMNNQNMMNYNQYLNAALSNMQNK